MQWDRDPATGDYVMENGAPKNTTSLRVPAYIRLKTARGKWMYAPSRDFGSVIGEIKKLAGLTQSTLLENVCEQALQPIVADGRAASVTAEVVDGNRYGRALHITIVDRQNEEQVFDFTAIGG